MKSLNKYLPIGLSDQINLAVRGPHHVGVRLMVADFSNTHWLQNFGVDATGWRDPEFLLTSGTVTESKDAVGRTLEMTVVSEYWKTQFDTIKDLSPYKTLISVERAITLSGIVIYIPLGVFRVYVTSGVGQADSGYELSVTAYSMEADVRGARFMHYPVAGVAPLRNTIKELIPDMLGDAFSANVEYDDTAIGTELDYRFADNRKLSTEMERLDLMRLLLEDRGVWGRFNRAGVYEVVPEPMPSDPPVWTVDSGDEGVLVSTSKEYHRDGIFNAVVATGENEDTAWAYTFTLKDTDPSSPTRWDGPFGRVPRFYYSPLLHTETSVEKAADTLLKKSLMVKSGMGLSAIPNPTLEVGDTVEVIYKEDGFQKNTRTERHLIETLTIGLGAESSMSATTKSDDTTLAELASM